METYRVVPIMDNVVKIEDRMINGGNWIIPVKKVFIIHSRSTIKKGTIVHLLVINNIEIKFSDDQFEKMMKVKVRIQNAVTSLQS